MRINRRDVIMSTAVSMSSTAFLARVASGAESPEFRLKYMLGSCLYGYTSVAEVLPEVAKVGASAIDLWPLVHGNQREQVDELGEQKFLALVRRVGVQVCLLYTSDAADDLLQV